jgi:hypothetical protein
MPREIKFQPLPGIHAKVHPLPSHAVLQIRSSNSTAPQRSPCTADTTAAPPAQHGSRPRPPPQQQAAAGAASAVSSCAGLRPDLCRPPFAHPGTGQAAGGARARAPPVERPLGRRQHHQRHPGAPAGDAADPCRCRRTGLARTAGADGARGGPPVRTSQRCPAAHRPGEPAPAAACRRLPQCACCWPRIAGPGSSHTQPAWTGRQLRSAGGGASSSMGRAGSVWAGLIERL